jgi:N-acyl-phosphatidylethanolamine-hydrolysing phospholipase D
MPNQSTDPDRKIADTLVPSVKPIFTGHPQDQVKATWLSHASFLVEMPAGTSGKGVTILFDPAFSKRCSPVQWFGSIRYTGECSLVFWSFRL